MIKLATADCMGCRFCFARIHPNHGHVAECMVDGYVLEPGAPFPWPTVGGGQGEVLRAACAFAPRRPDDVPLPPWPEAKARLPPAADMPRLRRGAATMIRAYAAVEKRRMENGD